MGTGECSATLQKGRIIKFISAKSDAAKVCISVVSQVIEKKKRKLKNPKPPNQRLDLKARQLVT